MELATALGFLVGSLVAGLVSGLVPVLNTVAYLLAVAALAPSDRLLPVVVLTTLGQMVAKSLLYLAGSGAGSPRFLGDRAARLDEVKQRLERAIPWQRSLRAGSGFFQLVLGREVQAVLYGYMGKKNMPLFVGNVSFPGQPEELGIVQMKSVALNFPVLEWTPFRTFATQLSFSYQFQLGFTLDIPTSGDVLAPAGATATGYDTAWGIFLRMQFDARYFMGSREDLEPPRG